MRDLTNKGFLVAYAGSIVLSAVAYGTTMQSVWLLPMLASTFGLAFTMIKESGE